MRFTGRWWRHGMSQAVRVAGLLGILLFVAADSAGTSYASGAACGPTYGAGDSQPGWVEEFTATPGPWEGSCSSDPFGTAFYPTSSGRGEKQWGYETGKLVEGDAGINGVPAFVGTDLAPTAKQIEHMGGKEAGNQLEAKKAVMSVPVAQSAIAVMITLPSAKGSGCKGVAGNEAEVTDSVLREVWEKDEKNFDHVIEGLSACARAPKLEARSSNSGATAGLKHYFYEASGKKEPWAALAEAPLNSEESTWPKGVEEGKIKWEEKEGGGLVEEPALQKCSCSRGNSLAATVISQPGEIGYADLADAEGAGFTTKWAEHENAAKEKYWVVIASIRIQGSAESPAETVKGVDEGSNCSRAKYAPAPSQVAPGEDWSTVKQTEMTKAGAYPICTLVFNLAWNHYKPVGRFTKPAGVYTEGERNTVLYYLKYAVSGGQNATLKKEHWGALAEWLRKMSEAGVTATHISWE